MTDATPPPEEPLGEQARRRIRAELLAAAQQSPAGPSRRWVVPATAAASVALVAGLTAWTTGAVGGDPDDRTGPATGTPATAEPTPAPPVEPVPSGTVPTEAVPPDSVSSGTVSTPAPPPATPAPTDASACPRELRHVLRGAEQVAAFPEGDGGSTTTWVKGDRFVLCDVRDGTATVHKPLPLEPDLEDVATFRVSSKYLPTEDGYRTIRVAGGLVPDGAAAFDVAYRFPDGHVQRAELLTDAQGRTWWRMLYAYDDGGGNETKQPPIEVLLRLSGVERRFTLGWGTDTCAQANHGC